METNNEGMASNSRAAWSTDSLQEEAFRLLQDFQTAALKPGATEIDRNNVETARIIVEIAEKKSQLMDRQAEPSKIAELKSHGEQIVKALYEDVKTSLSAGAKGSGCAAVPYLQKNSLKSLDATLTEFTRSLDQHTWKAWNEACEELHALRVGCNLSNKQGAA